MIGSNFLKEFRIPTTFVQNLKDFQSKFDYVKKVHPGQFLKIYFVIHFHPSTIISHPHFLMDSYHFSSDLFQDKTIIVGSLRSR